jgi:Asp-tRNA(Asn)/Glu-tRNA(Gln) amidotransferase A subunit family amidase
MIRIAPERASDYRHIERAVADHRARGELRAFYEQLIRQYQQLDAQYLFTESFDADLVFEQLDEIGPLHNRELFGMPFGVKDVFNTKSLPTAMGSEIWKGFIAGNNARVVDEIADRGGIVFSKTTTAEFAVHYIQAGRTRNPHDAGRITGTSSSGSAVAVACGALPVCLGTQTAGSIVRPASFCGVLGFKPSFGAFDRTGTLKTTDTLDTIGLLGSDIYGLRKTFLGAFQKDPQYPFARRYFDELQSSRQRTGLRVGVVTDQFAHYGEYEPYVQQDFARALALIADAGVAVQSVREIDFINEIHPLHHTIYCKALSYYFQQEMTDPHRTSKVMRDMVALGSQVTTQQYVEALQRQPRYRAMFDDVFRGYDFLLTPSTASVAPPLGESERTDTCLIWTFLGYPVLSVPAFWTQPLGLPFGLQIVAPKFHDLVLFEFAERVIGVLRGEENVSRDGR